MRAYRYPITLVVLLLGLAVVGLHGRSGRAACAPAIPMAILPDLPEASGLAASRRTPGILWAVNDSNGPVVFALDTHGVVKGRIRIEGARAIDWEAIAVSRCAEGSCLYIGDIGDNHSVRAGITLYRLPEPQPEDQTAHVVETFTATYPNGPHDAEALFIAGDGGAVVVTKESAKSAALYRFPLVSRGDAPEQLEPVSPIPMRSVTDADVSPDGDWIALRTNAGVAFYRTRELLSGHTAVPLEVPVLDLHEPQGEGIAFGSDGKIYLAGEGGHPHAPGTFIALKCELPTLSSERILGPPAPSNRIPEISLLRLDVDPLLSVH